MRGSGEQRSIHGLEYPINWETVSPGVRGVSTELNGGMIGAGGGFFDADEPVASRRDKWEDNKDRTRE